MRKYLRLSFSSAFMPSRRQLTNLSLVRQFGNMLVLSATYMSSLSELVDRNQLQRLLRRTIDFLLRSKNISPSLRADADILTEIYRKIFGETPSSSFSEP
jgi:hypothetical protein